MAFEQKTWTDRVAEFINRRLLTKEDGSTELVTVARSEGTVSTEGDGFTAKNMNDLEQRIADEFTAQNDNFTKKFNELNNALNVRYNPENDKVEIYYNRAWREWKLGNMQTVYLYNDGEEVVELDLTGYTIDNNCARCVPTRNEDTISLTASSSTKYSNATVFTKEKIDLTDYTRLYALMTNNGIDYQLEVDVTNISEGYIAVTHQRSADSVSVCAERLAVISNKTSSFNSYAIVQTSKQINAAGTAQLTTYLKKIWVK